MKPTIETKELKDKKTLAHLKWQIEEYLKGGSVWTHQEIINAVGIAYDSIEPEV